MWLSFVLRSISVWVTFYHGWRQLCERTAQRTAQRRQRFRERAFLAKVLLRGGRFLMVTKRGRVILK